MRDTAGHLRWDWQVIMSAVVDGLERCVQAGPVASIGVDTWAVDYGLLDESGQLLSAPYSYRDHRTDDYRDIVAEFGAEAMYHINGLQLQPFNTIFQLARHDPNELARAHRLLWLPELIVHTLTGVAVTERTSAGSSGLIDVITGKWSPELREVAGIEQSMLGEPQTAGEIVGEWRGIPVALVAGHDTASAVAGMGPRSPGGSAFAASGTWMLVGIERPDADTSNWARDRNFTNEAGALGGIRFLRNVTGFWLLEQCRAAWGQPPLGDLLLAAESVGSDVPLVDVDDASLLAPDDMLATYTALADLPCDAEPKVVTRSIVESISVRTAQVLAQLSAVADFDDVVLFGGAARISLLVRRLAEQTRMPIRVGATEATTLGNAIVQGIALGAFATLDAGRVRISAPVDR